MSYRVGAREPADASSIAALVASDEARANNLIPLPAATAARLIELAELARGRARR